jgi:hypothetical protein
MGYGAQAIFNKLCLVTVFGLRNHTILDKVVHHESIPQIFRMTPLLILELIINLSGMN